MLVALAVNEGREQRAQLCVFEDRINVFLRKYLFLDGGY